MKFDFEECRSIILNATLSELDIARANVASETSTDPSKLKCSQISGIGLDIAPWHRRFYVGFRSDDEKWDEAIRYSIGDWKHYPVNGLTGHHVEGAPASAERYIGDTYDAAAEPREIAHLIFLAAAEALLDFTVTGKLRSMSIDAPFIVDDFPPHRCFEYVIMDDDASIRANYCEIVIANRITQRLRLAL
jgi:hypothetical protein